MPIKEYSVSDIKAFFKLYSDFTDHDLDNVLNAFELKQVKKRTILLRAGKVAHEVYYILEGCLRLYYEKDGSDISAYFFTEHNFAGAYDSFVTQHPAAHNLEAVEDCQVLCISYSILQQLYSEVPAMNAFVRQIIEARFVALHELYTSLILKSPEERYINLLNTMPNLIQRIPQHQLATFLGITPVSLSRIRNRVLKNKTS